MTAHASPCVPAAAVAAAVGTWWCLPATDGR